MLGSAAVIPFARAAREAFTQGGLLTRLASALLAGLASRARRRTSQSRHRQEEIGALALSGVTYGGIGERTGFPPTEAEYDNVARALTAAAKHAKSRGVLFGIEPVNRYESHLINTGWQAARMIERIGAENMFVHLDTHHMNIEEKGAANGILDARDYLKYIPVRERSRDARLVNLRLG